MRLILPIITLLITVISQSCFGQTTPENTFYNEDFHWTITLPEYLEPFNPKAWEKTKKKGTDMIEDTYDVKVQDQTKTIFVYKGSESNTFEAVYQPYSADKDDYVDLFNDINNMIYETFMSQIPGSIIDTSSIVEEIDDLEFHTFYIRVTFPNNRVMNLLSSRRLFGNKEFCVNIVYVDLMEGADMLNAWRESKFEKDENGSPILPEQKK